MRQVLASRTVVPEGGARATAPPPAPEDIADRFPQFEILECLGRGGMGVVYKARQKSLNRLVAIKILAPERGHESRFAERFAREAELLAKLNHPHIVTIHDFGETDGLFYLVMEFVDGVNLRDLLREGKLEPKQALAIVPPICEALQYAHDKGIVHRDIKPENLLLDREGRIKIADFGIAALMGSEGEEAGTPPYMAPEQSGQSSGIDHRADLYALGVVLYEMLTGERPTMDLVAPSRKVQIDVRLDEMVLRALEKTPELRYQTAQEFRTVVETMAAPAIEQEASNRERRKKRKKKVVFSLPDPLPSRGKLLGIAFAAVGVGVLLFVFAAQGWERISRWLSSEALHMVRLTPMTNGLVVISLLAALVLIGGFVFLIRKFQPASGSLWARRMGVTGLLGVLIFGWLVLKKDRFYPTSSLHSAYKAPVIGRVEFDCTNPKGGGSRISFEVKAWGDTQWLPSAIWASGLEGERTIQFQARVDASRAPVPVAMISTSLDGKHWETRSVGLRAESLTQALDFSNGLHAKITWSPIEVPGLEKLSPDPIQREVMRQASTSADEMHPLTSIVHTAAIGPVVERVVNEVESDLGGEALCFQSGVLSSIKKKNAKIKLILMEAAGQVDLMVAKTGKNFQLILGGTILSDMDNADWENATLEIVRKALERGPGKLKPVSSDKPWGGCEWTGGELPATFALRLASGVEGVVQVVGTNDAGSGLKIRYKLVNGRSIERVSEEKSDSIFDRARDLAARYFADVETTHENGRFVMQRSVREYEVHNSSKTGEASADTHRGRGPSAEGFVLTLDEIEGEPVSQALDLAPQAGAGGRPFLKRPYWESYVHSQRVPERHKTLMMYFDFGPALNATFKEEMLQLLSSDLGNERMSPIESLTRSLNQTGGMWINGLSPSLDLPQTATGDEVLLRIIAENRLGTNVRTLELRKDWPIQVAASGGDHFTAALVETNSGKRIILFRWEGNTWWSRVFELP
jgi:predicted Ser/Thr protein kinase